MASQGKLLLMIEGGAVEQLDLLCQISGASSHKEAVQYGFRLLRWLSEHLLEGDEILVRKKNGEISLVEFAGMDSPKLH